VNSCSTELKCAYNTTFYACIFDILYVAMHSGYMPPEYLFRQVVSKKLDIFSLGVVITKIIAGPRGHTRSAEMPSQEFLDQVQIAIALLHNKDACLFCDK
jgi:hypothetical protein